MGQRPAFGALKKAKPPVDAEAPVVDARATEAAKAPIKEPRIQTSIRMSPVMWAALNDLATRKTVDTGQRVTMHDLLIEASRHILAINGIKLS